MRDTENFLEIIIDGISVGRYSTYYVVNHLTKKKSPTRTDSFAMSNINDINQVEIPEIFIKFKYLPMELYRKIFRATRKAEFLVSYYDQDYNMVRQNMFYVKEESNVNPHAWGGNFYGFKEYNMNLVCTMNPICSLDVHLIDGLTELDKPYYLSVSKGSNRTLGVTLSILGSQALLNGVVTISFSNSEVFGVDSKKGSTFDVQVSSSGQSTFTINTLNVKQKGEYAMFLQARANDESYGATTISCILKVS